MSSKWYFIFCIIVISPFLFSAQFTEKRTKRAPSMNALKESCCTSFGGVLHASASLFSSLGSVQTQALQAVEAYATGDKQGWCATASREKLADCHTKLESLHRALETVQRECEEIVRCLKAS